MGFFVEKWEQLLVYMFIGIGYQERFESWRIVVENWVVDRVDRLEFVVEFLVLSVNCVLFCEGCRGESSLD